MVSFPSAAAGMKKLFKAEIFTLIGEILSVLGLVFTFLALLNVSAVWVIICTVCVIAGAVLSLIGYINSLIAVKRAGADNEGYNSAFLCMIFALVITIVSSILSIFIANGPADDIAKAIANAMDVIAIIFVIKASEELLFNRNKEAVAMKGERAAIFLIIPYIISILLKFITIFINNPIVNVVLAIISLVCAIVGYILYLSFIKKTSKNLVGEA